MKKQILAMALALVMLIGLVPMTAMADECEHDYVIEPTTVAMHQYKCTKCGDTYGAGQCKNNDNNQDGKCDLCENEYQHTCDEKGLKYKDSKSHNVTCSVCGAVKGTKGHSYVVYVSAGEEGHVKACACGAKKTSVSKHKDSNSDNKCDSCGYNLYTPPVEEHSHEYIPHSNNDGTHTSSCSCGLAVENIKCADYNGDNKCDSCEYVLYHPSGEEHEHNYVTHTNNNGTHTSSCTCGGSATVSCSDSDGDNNCDSCGYNMYTPPAGAHSHNFVPHSNNDGTHTSSCTCGLEVEDIKCADYNGDNKCDACEYVLYHPSDEEHEHTYVTHTNNDGTHTTSCNCGNSVTLTCLDSNGDNKCDSCGYQKYVHNCVGRSWISNNNGTHSSKCSCGLIMDGPYECQTINGKTCYMCGYNMHKCDFDAGITSNGDGTHNINCECGASIEFTCLDSNGDGKCDSCGYQKYVHNCEGRAWTSNNDGTHTSKCSCGLVMDGPYECQTINGRTCYMCGYDMHVCFAETEAVANKDGLSHSIFCVTCGKFWKSESHDWENGVCTACGAKSPFETAPDKPDDGKCTFGQHDQMIELGCICPICGECGHTYENDICKYCGAKNPTVPAPACKHPSGVSVDQEVVKATCEKDGYILTTKVCNDCGKTYTIKSPLGTATGHVWNQTITEATCTKAGNEHYECENCGNFYDVKIPRTNHKFVNGICACGEREFSSDDTPSVPSYAPKYTWDLQNVFVVGGPAY